jgi:Arc/MetJ-type ribon-helix-helix transcriptional regulator
MAKTADQIIKDADSEEVNRLVEDNQRALASDVVRAKIGVALGRDNAQQELDDAVKKFNELDKLSHK